MPPGVGILTWGGDFDLPLSNLLCLSTKPGRGVVGMCGLVLYS